MSVSITSPSVQAHHYLTDPLPSDCPIGAHALWQDVCDDLGIDHSLVACVLFGKAPQLIWAYQLDLPDGTTLRAYVDDTDLVVHQFSGAGELWSTVRMNGMTPDGVAQAVVTEFINRAMADAFGDPE